MISVICPFYNESAILEGSVRLMMRNLSTLADSWELIIVDDGSVDSSLEIARLLENEFSNLHVVSYQKNRGRGYALRTGVGRARGEIVVTTEIDSSWGDDIVHRIIAAFSDHPDADIIIASPHLPGGGYKNIPFHRVLLSSLGNHIIRLGLNASITMNTGMTRGYKREKFMMLPLDENGKEQHLEIVNKALAFGFHIYEIPALLEWKDDKLRKCGSVKRKSSSKIPGLIQSHLLFSLLAAPFRYIYIMSALLLVVACVLVGWGILRAMHGEPFAYLFLGGISSALFTFLMYSVGILAQQGRMIQVEMWRMRSDMKQNMAQHS